MKGDYEKANTGYDEDVRLGVGLFLVAAGRGKMYWSLGEAHKAIAEVSL